MGASLGAGLTQPVAIQAGTLYALSYVSRADRPHQHARLQINWLNAKGQLEGASIDVVPVDGGWRRQTMMGDCAGRRHDGRGLRERPRRQSRLVRRLRLRSDRVRGDGSGRRLQ